MAGPGIERVAVIGAGAIGSLLGAVLARRVDVTLVCRKAHAEAIASGGLRVSGEDELTQEIQATTDPQAAAEADLVLLTTKAFDIEVALTQVAPYLRPEAVVLLMQNGLGNEDAARVVLGDAPILRGLTYMGVTFAAPGHVIWTARGRTALGDPFGVSGASLSGVAALFAEAGLETHTTDDIRREAWQKTLGNIGINALGALTGMRNGELVDNEHTLAAMGCLVREAEQVANAAGYAFDSLQRVVELARATGANKNSMLQDIEVGRRTEIDFLNGAIVRIGQEAGLPVPTNRVTCRLVKAIEGRR